MTAKQKKFILNKLIPFILREEGRGFQMAQWFAAEVNGEHYYYEGIGWVATPSCGTACCIGGSIDFLNGFRTYGGLESFERAGEHIGLSHRRAFRLFDCNIVWPEPFQRRYLSHDTPLGKAKAAAALLREVVRTNGKCLDAR